MVWVLCCGLWCGCGVGEQGWGEVHGPWLWERRMPDVHTRGLLRSSPGGGDGGPANDRTQGPRAGEKLVGRAAVGRGRRGWVGGVGAWGGQAKAFRSLRKKGEDSEGKGNCNLGGKGLGRRARGLVDGPGWVGGWVAWHGRRGSVGLSCKARTGEGPFKLIEWDEKGKRTPRPQASGSKPRSRDPCGGGWVGGWVGKRGGRKVWGALAHDGGRPGGGAKRTSASREEERGGEEERVAGPFRPRPPHPCTSQGKNEKARGVGWGWVERQEEKQGQAKQRRRRRPPRSCKQPLSNCRSPPDFTFESCSPLGDARSPLSLHGRGQFLRLAPSILPPTCIHPPTHPRPPLEECPLRPLPFQGGEYEGRGVHRPPPH